MRNLFAVLGCLGLLVAGCSSHGNGGGFPDSGIGEGGHPMCSGGAVACSTNAECQDRSACNGQEVCQNGCCAAGAPLNCTSPYTCATGTCSEAMGGCSYRLNHTLCPAGQRCTSMSGCLDPNMVDCSENGDLACVPLGGNPCDGEYSCNGTTHRCVGSPPLQCNDMNDCTNDACIVTDGAGMCTHTPNVDLTTDVTNCGTCRHMCGAGAHEVSNCAASTCVYMCSAGWVDANHDPSDGCECMGGLATDVPDLMFMDSNCDGIDGDAVNGVFVAVTGDDTTGDGSMANPLRTLAVGISLASTRTLQQVFVGLGVYAGPVRLVSGVGIFGGYDPANHWQRALTNITTIRSPNALPAVVGNGITAPTEVQLFTIQSQATTTTGSSSYAVRLTNSTGTITLRGDTVNAGDGGPGLSGYNGISGSNGTQGDRGNAGCSGCMTGGGYGNGGASACGAPGGAGGLGRFAALSGLSGANGSSSSGTGSGGVGGVGGASGGCGLPPSSTGGTGMPGAPGTAGLNGTGTAAAASLSSGANFVPGVGADGTDGGAGSGGGGGGGGGGGSDNGGMCTGDLAGGGGGGGGAGCGGLHGTGGGGGGGSFPVAMASAVVVIDASALGAGRGGVGGHGGAGGVGGTGGLGGLAGSGAGTSSPGGVGGLGGVGGVGGSATGGPGGPSVCVGYTGQPPTLTSTTTCIRGGAGAGGTGGMALGGTAAPNGAAGYSDVVVQF